MTYSHPELNQTNAKKDFIYARIKRLWPAHLITLALMFMFAGSSPRPLGILLANILLIHAWIPVSASFFSYNGPSWSISTELLFYLAFPLLIKNFAKSWWWKWGVALLLALAMVSLATIARLPTYSGGLNWEINSSGVVYISPLARIFEFVTGMCLALAFDRFDLRMRPNLFIGSSIEVAVIVFFLSNAAHVHEIAAKANQVIGSAAGEWVFHSAALLPGSALLILVMAFNLGILSKWLGSRLGKFLGALSFPIYMVHYVILNAYVHHATWFAKWSAQKMLMTYLVVLAATSTLIWLLTEPKAGLSMTSALRRLFAPSNQNASESKEPKFHPFKTRNRVYELD